MISSFAKPTANFWALLALTRFVLAMIVFLGHLGDVIGRNQLIHIVWGYGELAAVIGFFIISGFSIAHSIEQRPKRYLLRRFWRIWPTYLFSFFLCTLTAVFMVPHYLHALLDYSVATAGMSFLTDPISNINTNTWSVCIKNQHITRGMIIGNLLMLQGILVPVIEANAATWTLAIEEWCYLFAPLFKRCSSWIIGALIIGSAYCYAHAEEFRWIRFAGQIHGIGHISFIWSWLLGFFFYRYRTSIIASLVLLSLPVWLICGANELGGIRSTFTLLVVTFIIAFGERIVASLNDLSKIFMKVKIREKSVLAIQSIHIKDSFIFLGNISYPLYIIHYPIFYILFAVTMWRNPWVYFGFVFLLSMAVYFIIDKPNRRRWEIKPK